MLYTPLSNPDFDIRRFSHSGQEPLPGVSMRTCTGAKSSPCGSSGFWGTEETNQRSKSCWLTGGQGPMSFLISPPFKCMTLMIPWSTGQVGYVGGAIDSVRTWICFPKTFLSTRSQFSLVTHYPSNTAILFPMYLALAERKRHPVGQTAGSVQNDITLEECTQRPGIESPLQIASGSNVTTSSLSGRTCLFGIS